MNPRPIHKLTEQEEIEIAKPIMFGLLLPSLLLGAVVGIVIVLAMAGNPFSWLVAISGGMVAFAVVWLGVGWAAAQRACKHAERERTLRS